MRKYSYTIWPKGLLFLIIFVCYSCLNSSGNEAASSPADVKQKKKFKVIAYWTGSDKKIDRETILQLDQIIYSFLHLEGNSLNVSRKDSLHLEYLSSLKELKPKLKVLISLGGWGGCETCSEVFSSEKGREDFTLSVKKILQEYDADGIDLDWEYPAIEGYPGHEFKPEDRENFTLLVKELREGLGENLVISFAAGGFQDYLKKSVEWNEVMPLMNHVNLMSYDMVNGGSDKTGHHSSLFSTPHQKLSTNKAVKYLDSIGVPREKIVIGAAFYARVWENVENPSNALYEKAQFKESVLYKDLQNYMAGYPGFEHLWDSVARAPFSINKEKALFATYDDSLSVAAKTEYALNNNLGGIMFWQLSGDKPGEGLLDAIDREIKISEN